jgi:hypothetical protein
VTFIPFYLQTSVQCSKALSSVSEHLESQIAPPLQELSRRIRYRVDVLRDTYAAQLELLEGSSGNQIINILVAVLMCDATGSVCGELYSSLKMCYT